MTAPMASHSFARSLAHSLQRLQVSSSSQRALVSTEKRRTFVSSSVRGKSDSPTGNDATPARTHRSDSPRTSGGPDVDSMTGEAKNSSTATFAERRQGHAQSLADLTQSIAQRQRQEMGQSEGLFADRRRATAAASAPSSIAAMDGQTTRPSSSAPALAPSGYSLTNVPMKEDPVLKALVNNIMRDGKKASATRYVVDMLQYLGHILHADPLPAVKEAIRAASPLVRMQTRKEGGKNTQVPLALFPQQARRRGIIAILEASKKRKESSISMRLAREVIAVLDGSSAALARKIEVHKLATVNRGNTGVRV